MTTSDDQQPQLSPEDWVRSIALSKRAGKIVSIQLVIRDELRAFLDAGIDDDTPLKIIAKQAIQLSGGSDGSPPTQPEVQALAETLKGSFQHLIVRLGMNLNAFSEDAMTRAGFQHKHWRDGLYLERDGMLYLEAEAVDHLKCIGGPGGRGEVLANRLRSDAQARWADFVGRQLELPIELEALSSTSDRDEKRIARLFSMWSVSSNNATCLHPILVLLAEALWTEIVKPGREKPPAMMRPVLETIMRAMTPGTSYDPENRRLKNKHDEFVSLVIPSEKVNLDSTAPDIPVMQADVADVLGQLNRLYVINGHRLVRGVLKQVHANWLAHRDLRVVECEGGWPALADLVGADPEKDAKEIASLVAAFGQVPFEWPDGAIGTMWGYRYRRAKGRGHRSSVQITVATTLVPTANKSEWYTSNTVEAREASSLVPILDLPPMVGRKNEHGALATLQMLLLTKMRADSEDLFQHGGIYLPVDERVRYLKEAGVPKTMEPEVFKRWTRDGEKGDYDQEPAFLKCVEKDRFTLGDAWSAERDFLTAAGQGSLLGRHRGQLGVKAKRRLLKLSQGGE